MLMTAAVVAILGVGDAGLASRASAHSGYGTTGPAHGAWGPVEVKLTVGDVRSDFEHWLEWQGNPRLKLGNVKDDGKNTIVAEVVTKDGSLVDRYRINRNTGAIWRAD
jgi:hypothetical protein